MTLNGKTLRWTDQSLGALLVLGGKIASIPELLTRPRPVADVRSIAVVRLWAVGEAVLTLPMVRELRRQHPHARIDAITTSRVSAVLRMSGLFDEVVDVGAPGGLLRALRGRCPSRHYDAVIDTEPFSNGSALLSLLLSRRRLGFSLWPRGMLYTDTVRLDDTLHESHAFIDLAKPLLVSTSKVPYPDKLIELKVSSAARARARSLLKGVGRPLLCVAPAVADSAKSRMWPMSRMAKVVAWARERGMGVVLVGGKGDAAVCESVARMSGTSGKDQGATASSTRHERVLNLAGQLSLEELAAVCKECDLMLSNDTGPMHIAAAQGCKVVGLFGPNVPSRFAPLGKENVSVYRGGCCPYSPCINVHRGSVPECRFTGTDKEQQCMKAITVPAVQDALRSALQDALRQGKGKRTSGQPDS